MRAEYPNQLDYSGCCVPKDGDAWYDGAPVTPERGNVAVNIILALKCANFASASAKAD